MIFWNEIIRSIQLFISMNLSYNNLNKETNTPVVSDKFMYVHFILFQPLTIPAQRQHKHRNIQSVTGAM